MDTEIRNIFDAALEPEPEPQDAPVDLARERETAVLDYAISAAVRESGTRDPELLEHLLRRTELRMEDGAVAGLTETLEALRRDRPYLFRDGGSRPVFAAATQGRSLSREDEAVAQRYRNNPWYKK